MQSLKLTAPVKGAKKDHKTELGDDWPERHKRSLADYHGPALEKARELYPLMESGALLLLFGGPGAGKTGMATWWEQQRLSKGRKAGRFLTAQDFFSLVKGSWQTNSEHELITQFRRIPYLVFDEIDERADSKWENRTLFNLINHRYIDQKATVLISNLDFTSLTAAYSQKFLDRIAEAGGMVECHCKNYRTSSK